MRLPSETSIQVALDDGTAFITRVTVAGVDLDALCAAANAAVQQLIAELAEQANERVQQGFAQSRRYLGLPPYLMTANRTMRLPERFKCPECGGRLRIDVDGWSTKDGTPSAGSIYVHCIDDDDAQAAAWYRDEDYTSDHRYYHFDWDDTRVRVDRWVLRYVRVRERS